MDDWFNEHLSNKWTGHQGPTDWLTGSLDLTPVDNSAEGFVKERLDAGKLMTVQHLKDIITEESASSPLQV